MARFENVRRIEHRGAPLDPEQFVSFAQAERMAKEAGIGLRALEAAINSRDLPALYSAGHFCVVRRQDVQDVLRALEAPDDAVPVADAVRMVKKATGFGRIPSRDWLRDNVPHLDVPGRARIAYSRTAVEQALQDRESSADREISQADAVALIAKHLQLSPRGAKNMLSRDDGFKQARVRLGWYTFRSVAERINEIGCDIDDAAEHVMRRHAEGEKRIDLAEVVDVAQAHGLTADAPEIHAAALRLAARNKIHVDKKGRIARKQVRRIVTHLTAERGAK